MSSEAQQEYQEYKVPLGQALLAQWRISKALLLREVSLRLGPQRFGYLFVITEMIWGSSFLGIIHYFLEQPVPYGNSIIFYMFTGMFPYTLYSTLQTRVAAAVDANRSLLSFPAITPQDALFARAGLEVSFLFISFLIFYGTFIMMEAAVFPAHPIELLLAIVTIIFLGFGVAVNSMILRNIWLGWKTVDSMIARVLFFVSGVFFQVEYLPPFVRNIIVWNPLVHALEWVRYCIFPHYFTQVLDRRYLITWALASTVLGLAMERLIRPRLLEGR